MRCHLFFNSKPNDGNEINVATPKQKLNTFIKESSPCSHCGIDLTRDTVSPIEVVYPKDTENKMRTFFSKIGNGDFLVMSAGCNME